MSVQEHVRIYEDLRTAHLERAHQMPPATVVYRRRRYDFDESMGTGLDLVQAGSWTMARLLLTRKITAVEINEPLQLGGLARTALAVAVVSLNRFVRRLPVALVSYAIENSDPFDPPSPTRAKTRLRRVGERLLTSYVADRLDRIVYGTHAAKAVYEARLGRQLRSANNKVILALPEACGCSAATDQFAESVLFLGAFSERKGLRQLLAAWPAVLADRPDARLTLVGKGPLEAEARQFADTQPSCTLIVDPPRSEVHRQLRQHALLVLFSQRREHWREQIGLPITEALAHGCGVVASSETGLAVWLESHGHAVLPPDAAAPQVANAIGTLLAQRRTPDSVLADLPSRDGRIAADAWLFEI